MQRREQEVQRAIIDYLEAVVPGCFLYAIPNASIRYGRRAGNAVPGLRKGMPDLGMIWMQRPYFFEVKPPAERGARAGTLSKDQIECCATLRNQMGVAVAVVDSIEGVRAALKDWGVMTRESAAGRA